MRNSLVATFVLGLGLGLGACGGGGIAGEVSDWKDKMCKCADKDCAEKTWDDYKNWRSGKKSSAKELSKGDMEKIMSSEKEMKECRNKLRDGAGGDTKAGDTKAGDTKPAEGGDKAADPAKPATP